MSLINFLYDLMRGNVRIALNHPNKAGLGTPPLTERLIQTNQLTKSVQRLRGHEGRQLTLTLYVLFKQRERWRALFY